MTPPAAPTSSGPAATVPAAHPVKRFCICVAKILGTAALTLALLFIWGLLTEKASRELTGDLSTILLLLSQVPFLLGFILSARFILRYKLSDLWLDSSLGVHVRRFLAGCAGGAGAIALIWLYCYARGAFNVESVQFVPVIFGYALAFAIQSSSEEFLIRGVLTRALVNVVKPRSLPPAALIIVLPSVLFGCLHLGNDGATVFSTINTVLVGIVFTQLVLAYRSLPLSCGAHAAWNFTMSSIAGIPVSGVNLETSMLSLDIVDKSIIGGTYGFENTWMCLVILLLLAVLLGVKLYRRPGGILESIRGSKYNPDTAAGAAVRLQPRMPLD